MTTRAWGAVALCALAAALAGCGSDGDTGAATAATPTDTAAGTRLASPDATSPAAGQLLAGSGGLAVAEVLADTTGEPLVARAFVVVAPDGGARLCDALAESSPPQCGGPSIAVTGLPPELVAGLAERSGVRWSDAPVQLIGSVRGSVFVNDPAALAAS